MKEKSFFFGLYCADFLVDTNHLTNEATGCYIKLLCRMFLERDCSLKYAHAHRICGFSNEGKKWQKLWNEQLEPLFMNNDDKLSFTNKRLLAEFNKINKIREQRSVAGKRGVLAKMKYRNQTRSANASALPKLSKSNIELDKERIIDRFSSVSKDNNNKVANNILNKQG